MPRRLEVRRSSIHGNGVFALQPIKAQHYIARYGGLLRTHAEAERMDLHGIDSGHTFLFSLNDRYVLDATGSRCSAKWFNHSCKPNCESVLIEHPGADRRLDRIVFRTIASVRAGEELTLNYGIELPEKPTPRLKAVWRCLCGHRCCTGTMLSC
jgi:SET domain-containing protein